VDDGVRRILFSPAQVQEVLKDDKGNKGDLIEIKRAAPKFFNSTLPPGWKTEKIHPWNKKGQRVVTISVGERKMELVQHLSLLTPQQLRIDTVRPSYNWVPHYFTQELDPAEVRSLVANYYAEQKLQDSEKRLNVARFLYQAGWLDQADKELASFEKEFPDLKNQADAYKDQIKKRRAGKLAETLLQAARVGPLPP
jgi:hypothetical protein